jgi:hypothetical protein
MKGIVSTTLMFCCVILILIGCAAAGSKFLKEAMTLENQGNYQKSKTAYIWWEKKVGSETLYRSEQTTYKVYEGSLSLTYKVNYQIIDTATSKILKTDILQAGANDEIQYAEYEGDPATLHQNSAPAKKAKGLAGALASSLTGTDAAVEQKQFQARRNFKTVSELSSEPLETIGKKIAFSICQYFDEEMP